MVIEDVRPYRLGNCELPWNDYLVQQNQDGCQ